MSLPSAPLSRKSRLAIATGAALVLHLLALPWLAREILFKLPQDKKISNISLVQRSSAASNPSQGIRPVQGLSSPALEPRLPKALSPALARVDRPKQEKVEPVKLDGQLVSLGQPTDERPPEQPTKYLSEHDSRVLKETRAKETSAFFKNALSKAQKEGENRKRSPASPTDKKHSEPPAGAAPSSAPSGGAQAQASEPSLPDRARQERMQLKEGPAATIRNRQAADGFQGNGQKLALARLQEKASPIEGQGEGPGGPELPPGVPNGAQKPLMLTLERPLESLGPVSGGPMPDDLRGVEQSNETLLNSRSFRYAGYLNRVKEQVGRIWSSDVQEVSMRRDPTGQLYSFRDRRTVIEFTLDKAGEIKDVKVQASSGVDYLDRVAVDAFKKAERFPNPPTGLLGTDGIITLPFAFTLLATTGGFHMQMGPAYLPNSPAQRGW